MAHAKEKPGCWQKMSSRMKWIVQVWEWRCLCSFIFLCFLFSIILSTVLFMMLFQIHWLQRKQEESSSSNWILISCQPHRVTSGQSNSGHKQIHISELFSHINPLSSQSTKPPHKESNYFSKILQHNYPLFLFYTW